MSVARPIDLSLSADAMKAALRARFLVTPPGPQTQRWMAPDLAYGRHAGPPAIDAREAAVVVMLYPDSGAWLIPAMVRPAGMKLHGGQVALPGGAIEAGETPCQTALRELQEELGVASDGIAVVGPLSALYVFNSNFWLRPFLAIAARELQFVLNPEEAEALVEIPLAALLDPQCRGEHTIERGPLTFRAPHYQIGSHRVWGATSLILAQVAALFE